MPTELRPEDLAYAAGIIDGEGCIYIAKQTYKEKGWPPTYWVRLAVVTCDEVLAPWLYMTFGGSLSRWKPKNKTRLGYYVRWIVTTAEADRVLRAVLPYLKLKKPQAELAIQFRETVKGVGKRYTDEERAQKEEIYERMKLLKDPKVA